MQEDGIHQGENDFKKDGAHQGEKQMKKACIFGAGQAGMMAVKWLPSNYKVECFIDNNPKKQNQKLKVIQFVQKLDLVI